MIKVVIAEDDYRIGGIHEKFLSKVEGFQVIGTALNGEETLKLLTENEVDLLLLDIYMPDILGSDVMAEIRKRNLKVDIIIISAATEKDIVEQVIRYGAIDYILKPVEMQRFIATLERYKEMRKNLNNNMINQELLDNYFGFFDEEETAFSETPKGIDPITLEKVKKTISQINNEGITAEAMGERIGVTRTTARRYLEYLISQDRVKAELNYGTVGRPERRYILKK